MSRTQTFVDQVMPESISKRAARVVEAPVPPEPVNRLSQESGDEGRRASRRTDIPRDALIWWPC